MDKLKSVEELCEELEHLDTKPDDLIWDMQDDVSWIFEDEGLFDDFS